MKIKLKRNFLMKGFFDRFQKYIHILAFKLKFGRKVGPNYESQLIGRQSFVI